MSAGHELHLKWLGIDTYQEAVIYMRRDCEVCRSEGFETLCVSLMKRGSLRTAMVSS